MVAPRTTPEGGGMTALRGAALTYTGDPFERGLDAARVYEPDAVVAMSGGRVAAFGPAAAVLPTLPPGTAVVAYPDSLVTAGFLDGHAHYPQTPAVAGHGGRLVEWLERHAFPAERACEDPARARAAARAFLAECLRNGITTSAVYCTVHPHSVDVFFEEAEALGLRAIAGKLVMNRNAPGALLDSTDLAYEDSRRLLERWHGRGRLLYALSPRFAPTSTPDQLAAIGRLRRERPDVYVQTHLSENRDEVEWVRKLFPERRGYLDVYDHHGLLGPRTLLGHGLHLEEPELQRIHDTGASIIHCPTSNLFLGSGLFDLAGARRAPRPVRVGIGTDIGAGTTFSMLGTLNEAYKVAALRGAALCPGEAFYLATRGTARALDLEDRVGSIAPGMEADLAVLDLRSTPLIRYRMESARDLEEILAIQIMLGDDRAVRATYVAGKLAYCREDGGLSPPTSPAPRPR